jgi:hypothetical protein
MSSKTTTNKSVKIDAEILNKISEITKVRGQKISGYINIVLGKQVEKDYEKIKKQNGLQ